MSTQVEDTRIVKQSFILILRQLLGYDTKGQKVSNGKPYLLIQTTRGNISIKGVKNFVKKVCEFYKRDFNKASNKLIDKEFILTQRLRMEFDEKGVKKPTGEPYLWIETIKFGTRIDWSDMEEFCQALVDIVKAL